MHKWNGGSRLQELNTSTSEVVERLGSMDWSQTPLGAFDAWPGNLRTYAKLLDHSKIPMLVLWGKNGILLYNNAFSTLAGENRYHSLGKPILACKHEHWPIDVRQWRTVFRSGQAANREKQLFYIPRNGYSEETYLNVVYTPIEGDGNDVVGVLVSVLDITRQVILERRSKILHRFADASNNIWSAMNREELFIQTADAARLLLDASVGFCGYKQEQGRMHMVAVSAGQEGAGRTRLHACQIETDSALLGMTQADGFIRLQEQEWCDAPFAADFQACACSLHGLIGVQFLGSADYPVGGVFVSAKTGGREFSSEDEDTLRQLAAAMSMAMQHLAVRSRVQAEKISLAAAMEALPIGVAILDHKGGQIQHNAEFARIWGGSTAVSSIQDYKKYRAWWQGSGEEVQPEEWASARVVLFGEKVLNQMLEIERFDGTHAFIINNAAPVRDASSAVAGCAVAIQDITALRQAELAMHRAHELLETVIESISDRIFVKDAQGRYVMLNSSALDAFDRPFEEIIGHSAEELYEAGLAQRIQAIEQQVLATGATSVVEEQMPVRGQMRTMLTERNAFQDASGHIAGLVGISRDITERKRELKELHQLNRTFQAHTHSNQAMMHATNEQQYLQDVCRIIAEDCGYAMVWIGFAEDSPAKSVKPVAHYGFPSGYLETLQITWDESERGQGPTGIAIRTGKPSMCRDMISDPLFEPWRGEACSHGYASSLALPLISDGHVFGSMTIFSKERDAFTDEDVQILNELACDLAFGVITLRMRMAHARLEESRRQSEERYRVLVELSPDAVVVNHDNQIVFANPAAVELFGARNPQEIIGMSPLALFHSNERPIIVERIRLLSSGASVPLLEERIVRLDGEERDVEVAAAPFDGPDGRSIQVIMRDVTGRKAAEKAIRENEQRLRQSMKVGKSYAFERRVRTDEVLRSDEAGAILGLSGPKITQDTWAGYLKKIHPEDRERFIHIIQSLSPSHDTYTTTFRVVRGDGMVVYLEETAQGFFDSAGQLERLVGMAADVTKHEQTTQLLRLAHAELEKTAAQTQAILDNMAEALAIADPAGRFIYHNPASLALHGYENLSAALLDLDDMAREWLFQDDTGNTLSLEQWPLTKVLQGERFADYRVRVLNHETNKTFCGSFGGAPVYGKSGQLMCAIITIRDITQELESEHELKKLNQSLEDMVHERTRDLEHMIQQLAGEIERRKAAESTLRENARILEAFFEHTITPLAFLDRNFSFIRVNEAYARADARRPADFTGRNHFELYPQTDNERIFREVVETGRMHRAWAKPFLYPNNSERGITYWDWALTPIRDESNDVQFLVLSMEDVTQQTLAQDGLRRANDDLMRRTRQLQVLAQQLSETEERERKRLAGILHDDLQQLVTGARFRLAVLTRKVRGGKKLAQEFEELENLLDDSARICRNLSHELVSPALATHGFVSALEWLKRQIKEKYGLEVRLDIAPGLEVREESLAVFLYRSVQELLFNVVKHAGTSSASVKVWELDDYIQLTVSDSGKGFDAASIMSGCSDGFGLYSIQERVDLLGGALSLESTAGKGTLVALSVPMHMLHFTSDAL